MIKRRNNLLFRMVSVFVAAAVLLPAIGRTQGLNWPTNQLLPTFATPAATMDCIDVTSVSGAESDLFASLEGIVNRRQPRVACVIGGQEGAFTWLNLHKLPYTLVSGYSAILKYRTNFTGLVVTDPAQPHTLNLATTIAGVNDELICDPGLLPTLTNSPYNLPVLDDLRGRFTDKYQIYRYLYTNFWPQCSHRIIAGMDPNVHGNFRDYLVAVKSATVWLDPAGANLTDQSVLAMFTSQMIPARSVYTGWWPSEANGLNWIWQYGIPVLASDFFVNASVFSGVSKSINVPEIPTLPPLQNKVYVSLILSDGDNIQYMQHAMKLRWGDVARGTIPIGWTVSPLAADMDPAMLDYFWSTATENDCLVSGPSGAGYTHMQKWSSANLEAFARISDLYLQRSGLRVITVWDSVNTGIGNSFATNCPSLLGLTSQNSANNFVTQGLRTIGLTPTYSSDTNSILSAITSAASSWNGTAPMFLAAQGNVWDITPSQLRVVASALDTNKYVLVRPDHLFLLANRVQGKPAATTKEASVTSPGSATLNGFVLPNATNTVAWLEWGTNANYGFESSARTLAGNLSLMSTNLSGLVPGTIYHYRVVASNLLGIAWGADRIFTTGGRLKAWGGGTFGQTNLPGPFTNVVAISAGGSHGLALRNDNTVIAWGQNTANQTNVPADLSGVVDVSGGYLHSLALKTNRTLVAWGDDSYGQIDVPVGLTNVVAIAAGGYHSLALKSDGTVVAWGLNTSGQRNVPPGLTNAVDIAAGFSHSLALRADGTVLAWGANDLGQTNVPPGLNHVVAVAAGQNHSMALKLNGGSVQDISPACRWVADALAISNGTPVSVWLDAAHNKTAAQPNVSNQPKLYTNSFNGHNAVHFSSAANQYLTVSAVDSPIAGASDFALAVVFRTATPGLASGLFYQNTGLLGCEQPGVVTDWALGINGSQLGAGLGAGSSVCVTDVSMYGGNVTDGKPHIAIYARTGNTVRLYVDGELIAAQTSLCTLPRGAFGFQIGAMTAGSQCFDGDIAEIQLFNRSLADWEIGQLNESLAATYQMAGIATAPVNKWVADSLVGNDGASISNWTDVFGGKKATQLALSRQPRLYSNVLNGHKVLRFTGGSSQLLTVAATDNPISAAGSFSCIVVFKTSTPGNSSSLFYQNTGLLGGEQPGVVADWAFCINGNQLGAGLGAGANNCGSDFSLYGGNVTDGTAHIGICVRSGDAISLYVDGVRVATQTSLCTAARGNYALQIGAMTAGSLFFNGDIAEIQLYDRALSSRELLEKNEILAATYGIGGAAGRVVVWGNSASGVTAIPRNLNDSASIAAGGAFNLALNEIGSVIGWGNNNSGQTNVPSGLTNVAAIAGGSTFALAIGALPPSVTNITVSGYVNHDLTFALPASSPDQMPLNLRLVSLPGSGTLYQFSDGARGPAINSPNSLITDSLRRIVLVPGSNEWANPYTSFTFSADDGVYSSGPAQALVNIELPEAPQFDHMDWNSASGGTNGFSFTFLGSAAATYSVWAATNLIDWEKIGVATEAIPGRYGFWDPTATNWPSRFYRLSAP